MSEDEKHCPTCKCQLNGQVLNSDPEELDDHCETCMCNLDKNPIINIAPPNCPNCNKPLIEVEWEEYQGYVWNPCTGTYIENPRHDAGMGYSKCRYCEANLNDLFELGVANYER